MKRVVIGCTCCALGVVLYAANWLAATAHVVPVDDLAPGEHLLGPSPLEQAYSIVGHQPLVIGICLFIAGVVVLLVDLSIHYSSPGKASSTEAGKSADDSV